MNIKQLTVEHIRRASSLVEQLLNYRIQFENNNKSSLYALEQKSMKHIFEWLALNRFYIIWILWKTL